MKKFIAAGIIAIGGLGLLGMGATAASATPVSAASTPLLGAAAALVCTSATAQLATQAPLLASAQAVFTTATNALNTANALVSTDQLAYVTDAMAVITDTDNLALPQQILADTVTFQKALTAFVSSVVADSAANVVNFNAGNVVSQLNLQTGVLNGLISAACAVVPVLPLAAH